MTVLLIITAYLAIVVFTLGLVGATRRSEDRRASTEGLLLEHATLVATDRSLQPRGTARH